MKSENAWYAYSVVVLAVLCLGQINLNGSIFVPAPTSPTESSTIISDLGLSLNITLGGTGDEDIRDVIHDASGNFILIGRTGSDDFPITSDAFQDTYAGAGDIFITKISESGELLYSSYIGGSGSDEVTGISLNSQGEMVFSGMTTSSDFPLSNPLQANLTGDSDAFVTMLHPNGSLIFSTFLGGNDTDWVYRPIFDRDGNIVATGHSTSPDFPTTPNAFQPTHGGGEDALVVKLRSDGQELLYSSYLGGSGADYGARVVIDGYNTLHITGQTRSSNFPVSYWPDTSLGGSVDAFLTRVNVTDGSMISSGYVGGSRDDLGMDLEIDSDGYLHLVGRTMSTDFPVTPNAPQNESGSGQDMFWMKLCTCGLTVMSTYFGGVNWESARDIEIDSNGNAILSGYTLSDDFPMINPLQENKSALQDGCILIANLDNYSVTMSTYLGGSGVDSAKMTESFDSGILVVGSTTNTDWLGNTLTLGVIGSDDIFVIILNDEQVNTEQTSETTSHNSTTSSTTPTITPSPDYLLPAALMLTFGIVVVVILLFRWTRK
ncbi:MAG: hypothetical protein RTU30_13535 [Candidatus Thorarchaeota archaeon]